MNTSSIEKASTTSSSFAAGTITKQQQELKNKHKLRKFYITEKNLYVYSLWNIWYCLSIILLNAYLIYKRIEDLIKLIKNSTNYLRLSASSSAEIEIDVAIGSTLLNQVNTTATWPLVLSTSHLFNNSLFIEYIIRCMLIGLAILFLLLFVITQFKKIGNYSNDEVKFGTNYINEKYSLKTALFDNKKTTTTKKRKKTNFCLFIKKLCVLIWRHFLPINSLCHLLNALALFLPNIIFQNIYCYGSSGSNSTMSMNNTTFPGTYSIKCTFQENNLNLERFLNDNIYEIINFLIAICLLYIRYSLVFWLANKTLTFLLSLLGLLTCFEQLLQLYCLFYLNFFYFFFNFQSASNADAAFIQEAAPLSFDLILKTKFSINFLYFLLSLLVYFSLTPIYVFIYIKYKEKYFNEDFKIRLNKRRMKQEQQQRRSVADKMNDMDEDGDDVVLRKKSCFNTYFIHLCAATQLILICSCKIPFCYDYIRLHNLYEDFGIMLASIINILSLIIFIFIWFILTLKVDWKINFKLQFRLCHQLMAYDNKNFYLNEILEQIKVGEVCVDQLDKLSVDVIRKQQNHDPASAAVASNSATTTTTTTTTTITTAAILPTTATSTPSIRPGRDFVDLSTLMAPVTTGESLTTTTTTNSNDYSETLYRNEIRKSMRYVMNNQQLRHPPPYYEAPKAATVGYNDYFNRRKRIIANGVYLSTSSGSSVGTTVAAPPTDLTYISSMNDNNGKKRVSSIKYKPYTRRPVIYLGRQSSFTTTTTSAIPIGTKPTSTPIQINKFNSNGEIIEFESRV